MRQPDLGKVKDPKPGEERYKFDQLYLSNFATLNVKDELARIKGVGDVTFLGPRDYSMRIWLDPEKAASLGMTPGDVIAKLREQNRQVAAGRLGQPPIPPGQDFQYPLVHAVAPGDARSNSAKSSSRATRAASSSSRTWSGAKDGIELGARTTTSTATSTANPSVTLAVFQLPGSNALETAEAIKKGWRS